MNLQLWSELLSTLDALEKNKAVRGVIFTSGVEKDVFTAGNDIKESESTSSTQTMTQRSRRYRAAAFESEQLTRMRRAAAGSVFGCVVSL